MAKDSNAVAAYMVIRQYIIQLVTAAGDKTVQVPTILELSRKFGVSRPTVSKAMKALTMDGWVIGRPGLGGFTNPAKNLYASLQSGRRAGIVIGDGMCVNLVPHYLAILSALYDILGRAGYVVTPLTLTGGTVKQITAAVAGANISSLIWIYPPAACRPAVKALRAKGIRVLTSGMEKECGGVDDFSMDYRGMGYAAGKKLLAGGYRRPAYLFSAPRWRRQLEGMREAFAEAGLSLDGKLQIGNPGGGETRLAEILEKGRADAVFAGACPTDLAERIYRVLSPAAKNMRFIVAADNGVENPDFPAWRFRTPFAALAAELARALPGNNGTPGGLLAFEWCE